MAGIKIAVGGHGVVFVPSAAAGKALRYAGTVGKIHVEMEKEEAVPGAMAFHVGCRQTVILRVDARQILFFDGVGGVLCYHRLHGENIKTRVVHG